MGKQRRQHREQFKFKVALEAAKGLRTVNEIASEYTLHPNQVRVGKNNCWKKGQGCSAAAASVDRPWPPSKKRNCMSKLGDSRWNWNG